MNRPDRAAGSQPPMMRMTAEEFRQAGLNLFGPDRGWQTRLADALGTDRASISRYLSGLIPVPGPVAAAMKAWMGEGPEQRPRPQPPRPGTMIPFLDRLDQASRVLIAGAGGGFDVYSGVPLAMRLLGQGKFVAFANFSFTDFDPSTAEHLSDRLWRVDTRHGTLSYFPERWLCEWLARRDIEVPVYAFQQPGVVPLAEAYRKLVALHDIDLVVLVDGGTDSLIFGDEPGLGTVSEDAVSVIAANEAAPGRVVLAALGFGVDDHHGISHHSFLENVATLSRKGGHLGTFSLTAGTAEAEAILDLVAFANARQTKLPSIVTNSIAGAVRGEFGNFQSTDRTGTSTLFINPLMALYWTFDAAAVAAQMAFGNAIRTTTTVNQARLAIEKVREGLKVRVRQPIPL